jgi:predicted ATP-binding protein involved in virulence
LIDEPEISLHPSWQNRIVKIYKNFVNQNNNQIIIATHSPHIVASTPNESLRILVKEENRIKVISPDAYGMQVSKALTDIMGVEELRDVEVQHLYNSVKDMILNGEYQSDSFKDAFLKLEKMMSNDKVNFGLLKLELLKRESRDVSSK